MTERLRFRGLVLRLPVSIIGARKAGLGFKLSKVSADQPVCEAGLMPMLHVIYAAVAQLAEHHVANVIVVGSNPISRSFSSTLSVVTRVGTTPLRLVPLP